MQPWVRDDVSRVLQSRNPLFRPILGRILFDLNNDLPKNLALHNRKRIPGSPRCFCYERIYVNDHILVLFSYVGRDADPGILDVIWVVSTG